MSHPISLYCSDTSFLVETDLPYPVTEFQHIANTSACCDVQHFECSCTGADNFLPIVLEARDCSVVFKKDRLRGLIVRIPDTQTSVRCGTNKIEDPQESCDRVR